MSEIKSIISQLEKQRTAIERAIGALREIQGGGAMPAAAGDDSAPRRGRPPKKKRRLSEEGRQRIIEAAKKRWAKVHAAQAKKK